MPGLLIGKLVCVGALSLTVACSSPAEQPLADAASDSSVGELESGRLEVEAGSAVGGAPTFNRDIAPIVFANCAPCHRPGEVAPFSLLSYGEVRRRARQIAIVTESRYMPPWQPEPGYGEFRDARGLSTEQIALLQEWVVAGAPEGEASDLPPLPEFPAGWQLGEPDIVVSMPQPYLIEAERSVDIFRNFVVPIDTRRGGFVMAVEFRPHNRRVVHHAAIKIDRTGIARRLEGLDGEPGYSGMISGVAPGGHFLGWTPGRVPSPLEEGMAWELEPQMDLILEMHLLPTGKDEWLGASVGLYLTDEAPTRHPASIHLGSTTIDIAAGEADYAIRDEFVVPVDVDAVAAYPHAHYLGKEIKATATLPDGDTQWLLWIRDWDFNWQDEYRFAEPVFLPAGTRITLEISYDNSAENVRNPNQPPQRVAWGPRSADEMADLWIKTIPRRPRELEILRQAIFDKDVALAQIGYERAIERNPRDFEARRMMGQLLVLDGDPGAAVEHFEVALDIEPDSWQVRQSLGGTMLRLGRIDEAARYFGEVVAVQPGLIEARVNLAISLSHGGRPLEALAHYDRALALDPGSTSAHANLGVLLTQLGRLEEAVGHFRRAIEIEPGQASTHKDLANALVRQGRVEESVESLRRSVALAPQDVEAHFFLALGLAGLEHLSAAESHLQRVLELDPGHEEARQTLAAVRAARGSDSRNRRSLQ